ncbi:hypothetical protein [Caulobacter endophyticus]|uniref:hypothetical protein n=1 Tax=Caulobacter endophyticus TaxID=2172652 RepID=UPI00240F0B84|nr:hypothetical protein [Caulobacter endophyticus]MDG2529043.1 hypothetical protein [Caulobacter endophyticus]
MKAWLQLLGGLIVWAVHFAGVYLIASLADIAPPQARGPYGPVLVVLTLACVAVAVVLAIRAWRGTRDGEPVDRFRARLAALGSAVAAVAIVWQSAPALAGFD